LDPDPNPTDPQPSRRLRVSGEQSVLDPHTTKLDAISFDLGEDAVHLGSDPNVKEVIINIE